MSRKSSLLRRCCVSRLTMVTIVLLLMSGNAVATIDEIRALYKETNNLIQRKAVKEIYLYPGSSGRIWKRTNPATPGEDFKQSDFKAKAYLLNSRLLKIVLETKSQSGDWSVEEEYYFYPDGRTAFYFQRLVTFQGYDTDKDRELPPGPYIVEKRVYYDRQGKEEKSLSKAFVSSTKEPIAERYVRANLPISMYPDSKSLPFYSELQRAKQLK